MKVRDASDDDVRAVCLALRAHNLREARARRGDVTREQLADIFVAGSREALFRLVYSQRQVGAIAILSAYRRGAGYVVMHMIATDAWPEIATAAIRHMHLQVIGRVFPALGIRVAEAEVLDAPGVPSRRWLNVLGFREWGGPLPLGIAGEMFQRMVWVDAGAGTLSSTAPPQPREAAHV